jgi:hypothetical protein
VRGELDAPGESPEVTSVQCGEEIGSGRLGVSVDAPLGLDATEQLGEELIRQDSIDPPGEIAVSTMMGDDLGIAAAQFAVELGDVRGYHAAFGGVMPRLGELRQETEPGPVWLEWMAPARTSRASAPEARAARRLW